MKNFKKWLKRLSIIGFTSIILAFLSAYAANKIVIKNTEDKLYTSTAEITKNKVGLLLGTGKYLNNGMENLYYTYRIKAAVELYKAGKIEYILISGDNSRKTYDEPTMMKEDLVAEGVPASKIILDYAGFRTLDSVIRCKEVFGQEDITVISQQFHNERAIYIAEHKGIKAVGYNAQSVSKRYGFKTNLREKLARVKMLLDLAIGLDPKFLGKKIEIE